LFREVIMMTGYSSEKTMDLELAKNFVVDFARKAGLSLDEIKRQRFIVFPCDCGASNCLGFSMEIERDIKFLKDLGVPIYEIDQGIRIKDLLD
jgi:hypothetical protein